MNITSQFSQYCINYVEDHYNNIYVEPNTTRQQTIIWDDHSAWQPNTWEPYFPQREPDNTELLEQLLIELRKNQPIPIELPKVEPVKAEPKPKNGRLEGLEEAI